MWARCYPRRVRSLPRTRDHHACVRRADIVKYDKYLRAKEAEGPIDDGIAGEEYRIDGVVYVDYNVAADILNYTPAAIYNWVKHHPDRVHGLPAAPGRRACVRLSDIVGYARYLAERKTKRQQMVDWWQSHPQERKLVESAADLQRRLKRDGLQVNLTMCNKFMAKHSPKVWSCQRVLGWLEEDLSRRHLTASETRRRLLADLRLDVTKWVIDHAWELCNKKHGPLKPPFDEAAYISSHDAAEQYGITQCMMTYLIRHNKLMGRHWKDAWYILRSSLARHFANWQPPGARFKAVRDWFAADPQRLELTGPVACRQFANETGIKIELSSFYKARQVAQTGSPHYPRISPMTAEQAATYE